MLNKPNYHFAPVKNWMNDPNGTVYRDGVYHLFYQYNPEGSTWGNIQWAYATSTDLIHWKRKGIKLAPETHKGEQYCFSGCAYPQSDGYLLAYTSIGYEPWAIQQHARQRFARANADFSVIERLYEKDLDQRSQPFPVHEWRDPFIFSYRDGVYLLLSGICWQDGKSENSVLLYRAKNADCTEWEFKTVLATEKDHVIECPNMLIENGKAALIYSTMTDRKVKYIAGDFDGMRLWERSRGVVDWSEHCYYATNLSASETGAAVLYGWLQENLERGDAPDGTYSGCLSIPRNVHIDEQYRLHIAPIDAVKHLQDRALPVSGDEIVSDSVRARLSFVSEGDCRVRLTEGEREYLTLRVRGGEIVVDRVSRFPDADETEERIRLGGNKHKFDILVDGSATEIFVDGVAAVSVRMYRSEKPEKLFSRKEGRVTDVRAYTMKAAQIVGE